MNEQPYLVEEKIVVQRTISYNPNYGDGRVCTCGHTYYRHFDTYEDMFACGCKYCGCHEFVEMIGPDKPEEDRWTNRAIELVEIFEEPFTEVFE